MADPGQAAGSTSARSLIHVLGAVKQGFFSTVHSMSKSSRSNHGVTYLAAFISWLQLLSFVVQYEHTEWDPVTIQVARLAELSSSIGWIRRIDQDFSYLVLFFIAFAIVSRIFNGVRPCSCRDLVEKSNRNAVFCLAV